MMRGVVRSSADETVLAKRLERRKETALERRELMDGMVFGAFGQRLACPVARRRLAFRGRLDGRGNLGSRRGLLDKSTVTVCFFAVLQERMGSCRVDCTLS